MTLRSLAIIVGASAAVKTMAGQAAKSAKWTQENALRLQPILWLVAAVACVWLGWRAYLASSQPPASAASAEIIKEPEVYAQHTFDPANPPSDMPPLSSGENAECDTEFRSVAKVSGETRQDGSPQSTVTIAKVVVTLRLHITVWVPSDVSQTVLDHEAGHRQISESFYQTADNVAKDIADNYIGKQAHLSAGEENAWLQQQGEEITAEYAKQLNTQPTQLLYDTITDHSRNGVLASEAAAHALKNAAIESR